MPHPLAAPSPPFHNLPPELLAHIFDLVSSDISSIASCTLVCRTWTPYTYPLRFSTFYFTGKHGDDYIRDLEQLLDFLRHAPQVSGHIRALALDLPRSTQSPSVSARNVNVDLVTLAGLVDVLPTLQSLDLSAGTITNIDAFQNITCSPRPIRKLAIRNMAFPSDKYLEPVLTRLFSDIHTLHLCEVYVPIEPIPPSSWTIKVAPLELELDHLPPYSLPFSCLRSIFDLSKLERLVVSNQWVEPNCLTHYNDFLHDVGENFRHLAWWPFISNGECAAVRIPQRSQPLTLSCTVSCTMPPSLKPQPMPLRFMPLRWKGALLTLQHAPSSLSAIQFVQRGFLFTLHGPKATDVDDIIVWHWTVFDWSLFGAVINTHPNLVRVDITLQIIPVHVIVDDASLRKYSEELQNVILTSVVPSSHARAMKGLMISIQRTSGHEL